MLLSRLKSKTGSAANKSERDGPAILIVEDDKDQMEMLASMVLEELGRGLLNEENGLSVNKLQSVNVIKVGNRESLEKAAKRHKGIFLVILDCNIPDAKGGKANDQFVAKNHVFTGQHKSVDVLHEYLSDIPIALISTQRRFGSTVIRFYGRSAHIRLKFVPKENIDQLRQYVGQTILEWVKAGQVK